jgi:two-component system, LytTR family, response regulator
MELNCIVIDDEQTARNGLAADINEIPYLKIKALASNAFEALEKISQYSPELIFLDIEMPGLSGIDFLKLVKVKPMVIITTAYPQFALDGFEHGVIDYLLKPISQPRLRIACDKALEQFILHQQFPAQKDTSDYCYLKCNGKFEKIPYNAILYIEAANNYIFVYTSNKRFVTYSSLKNIAGQLPEGKFVRVHKSFIVGKEHITQINGNEIFIDQISIPLSRNFKSAFQEEVIKPKVHLR